MKQRVQCSLTDYYGLAKGRGYLRLICFIFVPFISCRYKNKLFLSLLLPCCPTCNPLSPHTHPFPFIILLVSHCTSSIELTKRWDNNLEFCVIEQRCVVPVSQLELRLSQASELTAPDETRSAETEQCAELQVHWAVGTHLHGTPRAPCRGHYCVYAHIDTVDNRSQDLYSVAPQPTRKQLSAPEVWPDKATSTISHHLIGPGE